VDEVTPFASALFRTNGAGAYLEELDRREIAVTESEPGWTAQLKVFAWVGQNLATAKLKGSWGFVSLPLGRSGSAPGLSGWAEAASNGGVAIVPGAKPRTYGTLVTRGSRQDVNLLAADIFANDSDPGGGALTLVRVAETSQLGAAISVVGERVYYTRSAVDSDDPDYFEYTVRNSFGGVAKGRVDVVVTDAQGQFNTRLSVENVGGEAIVKFRGVNGGNYVVQWRWASGVDWVSLPAPQHIGLGMFEVRYPSPGSRLYRVLTR
jgi:hypothetical protein